MNVRDLVDAMEQIAPLALSEPWDNTGLLIGDPSESLRGLALLCIDFTPDVLAEARELNAGALIAYHPPMFQPVKRIVAASPRERALLEAIRSGMAIYSPHTALDAAEGGVNDWLVNGLLGALDLEPESCPREAILPAARGGASHKIVTFVPTAPAKFEKCVENVRNALSRAGAGRIGEYESCSFAIPGTGSFRGSEQTNPALGRAGQLEFAEEVRLEMVVSARDLKNVVQALFESHPYEEPAFEIYALTDPPMKSQGQGRTVQLPKSFDARLIAEATKRFLGVDVVQFAAAKKSQVKSFGVCVGAGESLLDAAVQGGCGLFLTGEMRHHQILHAQDRGCTVVLAGHTHTERGYLPTLAKRLNALNAEFHATVSRADTNPWLYA